MTELPKPKTSPNTVTTMSFVTSSTLGRHMVAKLVAKGLLTKEEAASIFLDAATELRSGTEDELRTQSIGEISARMLEREASRLLGYPD